MMKKLVLIMAILMMLILPLGSVVYAQDAKQSACDGIGAAAGNAPGSGCTTTSGPSVDETIAVAVNILSAIVGIVAVVAIIVAGLRFITANGDSNNISSARNTILYALVGLVVAALAQVIVHFVLLRVSSTPQCNPGQVSTSANPCQ